MEIKTEVPVTFLLEVAKNPAASIDTRAKAVEFMLGRLQLGATGDVVFASLRDQYRRGKIFAIKFFKDNFGTGLRESKECIEIIFEGRHLPISDLPPRCDRQHVDPDLKRDALRNLRMLMPGDYQSAFQIVVDMLGDQELNRVFYSHLMPAPSAIQPPERCDGSAYDGNGRCILSKTHGGRCIGEEPIVTSREQSSSDNRHREIESGENYVCCDFHKRGGTTSRVCDHVLEEQLRHPAPTDPPESPSYTGHGGIGDESVENPQSNCCSYHQSGGDMVQTCGVTPAGPGHKVGKPTKEDEDEDVVF